MTYPPRPFKSTLEAGDRVWSVAAKRFALVDRDPRGAAWNTSVTFDGTKSSRYVNLLNLRFVDPDTKEIEKDQAPHDGEAPAAAIAEAKDEMETRSAAPDIISLTAIAAITTTSGYIRKLSMTPAMIEQLGRAESAIALRIGASGIEAIVCEDVARRQQFGLKKYGRSVADNPAPLRDWLQHAYEETLDKAIYLRRAIAEIDAKA